MPSVEVQELQEKMGGNSRLSKKFHLEKELSGCSITSNINNNNHHKGMTTATSKNTKCKLNSVHTSRDSSMTINTNIKFLDLCNGNTPPQHRRTPKKNQPLACLENEQKKQLEKRAVLPKKTKELGEPKATTERCINTPKKKAFQFWQTKVGHIGQSGEEQQKQQFEKPWSKGKVDCDRPKIEGGSTIPGTSNQTHTMAEPGEQQPNRTAINQRKTRKKLFSDAKEFMHVDSRVLEVSKQQINLQEMWTIQKLVCLITEDSQTDLEKVRAIWIWLCHNIRYDVDGFFGLSEKIHEPLDVLRSGRGVCAGYASLFKEMCSEIGMTCQEVSGYSRGAGYRQGQNCQQQKSNHMWNAIKLEDDWYLLDACWGAGTVDLKNKLFIPRYDGFFFLTDPLEFIETHWPDDPEWQLLQPLVSFQEFEQRVFKTSEFFKLCLHVLSPETSLVRTANGEATVSLGCAYPAEFTYQLNRLYNNTPKPITKTHGILTMSKKSMHLKIIPPEEGLYDLMIFAKPADTNGAYGWVCSYQVECLQSDYTEALPENPFNFWGLHQKVNDFGIKDSNCSGEIISADTGTVTLTFETSRPLLAMYELLHDGLDESVSKQCIVSQIEYDKFSCKVLCLLPGYYRVSVFVKDLEEEKFKNAANLLVHCGCPGNCNELFPSGLSNHCGPGLIAKQAGLSNPSHPAPIISTKLGKCNITFHTSSDIEVSAVLDKDQLKNNSYPMERYILLTHLDQKVSVNVLLPESGLYKVGLFARSGEDSVFSHICDYVVRCFTNPQWPPFPRVYGAWKKGCTLLQPRAGVLQEESSVRVRLKIPEACRVVATGASRTDLHLTKSKVWEGDVFTGPSGNILKIAAKFSQHSKCMNVILAYEIGGIANNVKGSSG
ncbi:kyphoscoliosis peptidase-like isoform X2 [Lissotriton helveticus]